MNANEALARMDYLHGMMNATSTYYRRKFYEEMKSLYEEFAAVRAAWDFVEDAVRIVKRFVKKILTVSSSTKWQGSSPTTANASTSVPKNTNCLSTSPSTKKSH